MITVEKMIIFLEGVKKKYGGEMQIVHGKIEDNQFYTLDGGQDFNMDVVVDEKTHSLALITGHTLWFDRAKIKRQSLKIVK